MSINIQKYFLTFILLLMSFFIVEVYAQDNDNAPNTTPGLLEIVSEDSEPRRSCHNNICIYEDGDVEFAEYRLNFRSLGKLEREIQVAEGACRERGQLDGCTFEIDGAKYLYFFHELDDPTSPHLEGLERSIRFSFALEACKERGQLDECEIEVDGVGYTYRPE